MSGTKHIPTIIVFQDEYDELKDKRTLVLRNHNYLSENGIALKTDDNCYVCVQLDDIRLGAHVVGANDRIVCLERW